MRAYLACLCLACLAGQPAGAHPHEFIDTGITFHLDEDGSLRAIAVAWTWDEFTSMLIVEDLETGGTRHGELTAEDKQRLVAQFSQWLNDYSSDLHVTQNGRPVELGGPLEVTVDYLQGRLVLNYQSTLPAGVRPDQTPVRLQVYDPSYYAFYELAGPPEIRGRDGCHVSIRKADIGAAQALYQRLLGELTEDEIMEQGQYPEVGGAFADEVVLECDARP